jgi:hypothetical protein
MNSHPALSRISTNIKDKWEYKWHETGQDAKRPASRQTRSFIGSKLVSTPSM